MGTDGDREQSQWHRGEQTMHRLLHVPDDDNPTVPGLPIAYGQWMTRSPLVALGTTDSDDHVWTTLLGGAPGTARPAATGVLELTSPAHLEAHSAGWTGTDPVLEALLTDGATHDGRGTLVSGLVVDMEHRARIKIAGRMLTGEVLEPQPKAPSAHQERVDVHLTVAIDEALSNCPKYLNKRAITPHESSPELICDSLPLPPEALDIISTADTFFISSRDGTVSMDTNLRGGAPGFVRVLYNSDADGVTLVYPEYSGNRLYQTLGNITSDPAVGITVCDFDSGDVLYLTGRADVLIGDDAKTVLPHSKMAVRIDVAAARLVRDGLPFRGALLDPSPYNPPVWRLAHEVDGSTQPTAGIVASLIDKQRITPTISRYTFRLSTNEPSTPMYWRAGQHVTLDFSGQLDRGWSHMRDHDPGSLNDDFVRTFTVSSAPNRSTAEDAAGSSVFELTVREHGPVTRLLSRWTPPSDLTVAVLGFGGEDDTRYVDTDAKPDTDDIVVVASGVGITPFMAQMDAAHESELALTLLWSVRAEDLPLAIDVIERPSHSGVATTLFVTGQIDADGHAHLRTVERLGARTHIRRMVESDVKAVGSVGRRQFYVCAAAPLHKKVVEWVAGEQVRFETFAY